MRWNGADISTREANYTFQTFKRCAGFKRQLEICFESCIKFNTSNYMPKFYLYILLCDELIKIYLGFDTNLYRPIAILHDGKTANTWKANIQNNHRDIKIEFYIIIRLFSFRFHCLNLKTCSSTDIQFFRRLILGILFIEKY